MAVYNENVHVCSCEQPNCLVCDWSPLILGEEDTLCWQSRNYHQHFQKMLLTFQGDEKERKESSWYLEDKSFVTPENILCNIKCIYPTTIIVPNNLPPISHSMFYYLIDGIISFLKYLCRIDNFIQLLAMMPPYFTFIQFNKPYTQVMHFSSA
jgi:hypothetical protein